MDVKLINVTKRYGALKALDDVTTELSGGQIVCVVGLNGAGKTSLLRCLAGLTVPDQGEVWLAGERLLRERIDLRRRFFFLPDSPALFDELPVVRNLSRILHLYEADGREAMSQRVAQVLEDLDMLTLAEKKADGLSRGQYYKVGLSALIALNPELWILDEPFASGMDPQGINVFRRTAREAANAGKTVVYTTQLLDLAERFSDRILVLNEGRLQASFATRSLTENQHGALESLLIKLREPAA